MSLTTVNSGRESGWQSGKVRAPTMMDPSSILGHVHGLTLLDLSLTPRVFLQVQFSDKYVNSTPYKKRKLTDVSDEGLTSEKSVSFLFSYGVEFTYLSLNCFFRNIDAAHTSLVLVIFSG